MAGTTRGTSAAALNRTIVFVDTAIDQFQQIVDALPASDRVVLLDGAQDGLAQITGSLAESQNLSAVTIISHGSVGALHFGTTRLDANCWARYADDIAAWPQAFAPGANILLYACNVAAQDAGKAFVQRLAATANTAVAAATHPVGASSQGGDWNLDYATGPIAAAPFAADAFPGLLTGAAPPPAGFPISISNFSSITSGGGFVLQGSASIAASAVNGNLGALQLTQNAGGQAGIATYNQKFSADLGITVNFTYASEFGSGADGIVFYLLNADLVGSNVSSVRPGGTGGALGYVDKGGGSGLTDAFLGVGLDTYGNFSNGRDSNGSGPGQIPNSVVVRGQGNGTSGYAYLTGAQYTPGIDGVRDVQINLQKTSANTEQVTVLMAPHGGSFVQVLSTSVNQTLPGNFYLGFTAGTGGSTDLHQITALSVAIPVTLSVGSTTVTDVTSSTTNPSTITAGDTVTFNYNVNNTGTNGDSTIVVANVPKNFVPTGWTVTDSSGTTSGAGSNIPVNLAGGASGNITITGTSTITGPTGDIGNTPSISTGSAYHDTNVAGTSNPTNPPLVVNPVTPTTASSSQSEVIGTVVPDIATDTLSITKTSGAGAVSLGAVVGGARQVIYTAPATGSLATDFVGYTVTETGGANVSGSGFSAVPLAIANPVLSIGLTVDSGSSQSDMITRDDRLHVGSDTAGTVTLTEGGQVIGTGVVTAGGFVDITPNVPLPQGAQTVTVTEGGAGATAVNFTLDQIPPVVAITSPGSALTDQAVNLVTGTGEAGLVVQLYDNGTPIGGPVTVSGGVWSEIVTLPTRGDNTITAGQTDLAGNVGTTPGASHFNLVPAPALALIKSQSAVTGQAGDIVTYTLTIAEAANTNPAYNLTLAEQVGAGETLVSGSETVTGATATSIIVSGNGFTVHGGQLLAGEAPITITYQARLDNTVTNGQVIMNSASLAYDSTPGGGLTYTGATTQLMTGHLVDQLEKTLVTTSQNGGNLGIPGETVSFDITATLAAGTQHLVLTDLLPAGFTPVSATVIAEGNITGASVQPGDIVTPTGQSLTLDLGTIVSPGSSTTAPADQIVVRVTATVDATASVDTLISNAATLAASVPGGAAYQTATATSAVQVVAPSAITGMVFLDGNCNGVYHVGDPGIAGVTVRLLDSAGVATGLITTTDSYGQYSFNNLIPGKYEVQVVRPQGTDYSGEKNAGSNALLDSDVDPASGLTDMLVAGEGQTIAGINAGLEFNGFFGGIAPNEIDHGMFLTNDSNNVVVGNGGNNLSFGAGGGNIAILDGKGLTSTVEINGTEDDIVTSCGPLVAQTQTSGSGYLFAGNGGSSTLNGGPGDAYLMGAGSNDLIFGGAGHNVIIGGGSTGTVTLMGGNVTGYTAGDREIAGGVSTEFLYQKGDGVVTIDGGLRAQDVLKISGYTSGSLIKLNGLDALYFGGNDLIVFYGASPYAGGVASSVSFSDLPGRPETVVVFDALGKPSIVASGAIAPPAAPAPLIPATPTPSGTAPASLPGTPSSQAITLSGYNQVFDFTRMQTASNVDTTISGSQGFAVITLGDGNNDVSASGYGNVITAGSGNNHILGGDTYQKVTVGGGTNDITVTGFSNTINAADGNNMIHAGSGGAIVHVGNGTNTIMATGSSNVIIAGNGGAVITAGDNQNVVTVGNGTNTVSASGYNNKITVGCGHSTITAGAGGETVYLGAGDDTVALAGWSNLLVGGTGHATVSGGTGNVFQIEGVGTIGGLDVADFGAATNDVLDLSKLLANITLTPANIASYVNVTGVGADTVVAVDLAGAGHYAVVATLRGEGANSLADLQGHSAIKL